MVVPFLIKPSLNPLDPSNYHYHFREATESGSQAAAEFSEWHISMDPFQSSFSSSLTHLSKVRDRGYVPPHPAGAESWVGLHQYSDETQLYLLMSDHRSTALKNLADGVGMVGKESPETESKQF